jgi:hypothetical protein
VWQADHGWPQIDVSRDIASGGSASSEPWWAIVPFQFLLISPLLAPVWVAGLVALFRSPAVRELRFFGWAWFVLAVAFMATGGKPYYLAGLLPLLLAIGALQVDVWLERDSARRALLVGAIALSAFIGATVSLPVLPAEDASIVVDLNDDVGGTIGWPELVETVSGVHGELPDGDDAVILTANYGEAGAIERFGREYDLPQPYSGHNAYGDWGPPPDGAAPVITIGLSPAAMAAHLEDCRVVARVDNSDGIDTDEQGAPIMVCSGPRRAWAEEWADLRHLD